MSEGERREDRRALLAFLERNWGELTLRDARSLCIESLDSLGLLRPDIKESLTTR